MSQLHAAFYRNLNLGHKGSPTREILETVLKDSGAKRVKSFQTNGTVLLFAQEPEKVVEKAAIILEEKVRYSDAVFIKPFEELITILDSDPFQNQGDEDLPENLYVF
ncbi:DUF1697 domain-containing protein [Oceanobacillus neutriphilus]|uniref:DUF1697 domain-containing protein n=1 Tax=Oceanobacillus neutriphilus TaxID=531815 RepID=A0ABQ2NUD6_9BACI|nr:DUF1697 domain-containing protein [Oceanobacillus neutriphilus]GGP10757.1 hypothetical protein GCM10011346_20150 [Oceanobacillus neutriphilus]